MHPGGVEVTKPGFAFLGPAIHEIKSATEEFFIHCLHALFRQRAGIFNLLFANSPPPRLLGRIVRVGSHALECAAWTEAIFESGILWVFRVLWLLLSVQVIKVTEKFVEPVDCWQVLVQIAQMILAELSGGIAKTFHNVADAGILLLESDVSARQSNFR